MIILDRSFIIDRIGYISIASRIVREYKRVYSTFFAVVAFVCY